MKFEFKITKDIVFKKYNKDNTLVEYKITKKAINKVFGLIAEYIINYGTDDNGYVDIPKKSFNRFKNGDIILEYLRMMGFIERSYYIKNYKAFGYRFSVNLIDDLELDKVNFETKDITHDEFLKKEARFDLKIDDKIIKRLKKDFDSVTFQGDFIDKDYNGSGSFIDVSKWFSNNLRFEKWKRGHTNFTWSSNRLYTNFTYLSSQARTKNILLSGEQLAEFDIHNSFPLMLSLYYLKTNPEMKDDYDIKEFTKSVLSGNFYSKLTWGLNSIRNCNKEGVLEYDEDGNVLKADYSTRLISRNETKQLFQVFLNSKTKRNGFINHVSTDIKSYMKMKYPDIYSFVEELNVDDDKCYDYLVSLETDIIFKIIKDIYSRVEDIEMLTCHDAIYVKQSQAEEVSIIWEEWMTKLTNRLPKAEKYKKIDYSIDGELFN